MLNIKEITDWYIKDEDGPLEASVYPGPVSLSRLDPETVAYGKELLASCRKIRSDTRSIDFAVRTSVSAYRVHYQKTVSGGIYILRITSDSCPDIRTLNLPKDIQAILTSEQFGDVGGLVIVCGITGHGKSTTISSVVKERVVNQGTFCLTVEDPPEFTLDGEYSAKNGGTGKIVQVPGSEDGFSDDLRAAMRCYPSGIRGSMLLVGETRDPDTATQVLRASVNGQLVMTTFHASGVIACLERILSMARDRMGQEEAASLLAHSLRAIIHQRLEKRKPHLEFLFSGRADSPVASRIKAGNLQMLSSELTSQRTLHENGILASRVLEKLI